MNDDEKEAEEYFWKYLKETFPIYDDFDYGDFEFKLLQIFKHGIEHGRKDYIKAEKAIEVVAAWISKLQGEQGHDYLSDYTDEEFIKEAKEELGIK